jgi:F0F1-type ATP synthase membrane subunit b/b'
VKQFYGDLDSEQLEGALRVAQDRADQARKDLKRETAKIREIQRVQSERKVTA